MVRVGSGAATSEECSQRRGAQNITPCESFGRCGVKDGVCVADSEASCAASRDCVISGRCAFVADDCVPTTDAHCAASIACRQEGNVSSRNEQCVTGHLGGEVVHQQIQCEKGSGPCGCGSSGPRCAHAASGTMDDTDVVEEPVPNHNDCVPAHPKQSE